MKKFVFILLYILTSFFSAKYFSISAFDIPEPELSDPYISLEVEELVVKPGDTIVFSLIYGNLGPEVAENVMITLNQPLGGRSPLEFIGSSPAPDRWINSEYGSLPEFIISKLEVDNPETEKNQIEISVKVRPSIASQKLTPSVSLQAPKREAGKTLIRSKTEYIEIISQSTEILKSGQVMGEATESARSPLSDWDQSINFKPTPDQFEEQQPEDNNKIYVSSGTFSIVIVFVVFTFLLVLAFIAGRKSKPS